MGLMNGQAHGFFVMVQRRSADVHKGILIGLRDDEMWAMLGLCINFGNILADDAQTKQLQPGNKQEDADGRCPPGNGVAKDQTANHHKDKAEKGNQSHTDAKPGSHAQRRLREVYDAVNSIAEQLPKAPLGLTRNTFNVLVGEPEGFKTNPAENAFGEAVVFVHGKNSLYRVPPHETEIACTVHDVGVGDLVDDTVFR